LIEEHNLPNLSMSYDDYKIGDRIYLGSYFLTKKDIMDFASEWDPIPFHTSEKAGLESFHNGLIASGTHLLAIRIKLIQSRGISPFVVAAMGWDKIKFLNPGRPDDKLSLSFKTIEMRLSRSQPDKGIVTKYFEMKNQNDTLILTMNDTILVKRRHG